MNANDSSKNGKPSSGDDKKHEAAPAAPSDPVKHDNKPADKPAVDKPAEPVKAGPPVSDR